MGTDRETERESKGIRGIIGMMGGVKSACSTTAMRSRGCRQMNTSPPKKTNTDMMRKEQNRMVGEQKKKGGCGRRRWRGCGVVGGIRFRDTEDTVRVTLTVAAVRIFVRFDANEGKKWRLMIYVGSH